MSPFGVVRGGSHAYTPPRSVPPLPGEHVRSFRSLAFLAFFLSGASSLIFQNIWGRMLHHVFGATGVAISTVVTAFMAGLGLGAWIASRYADRIKHPIITYAIAELGVAIWALVVPVLVSPEGWLAGVNGWLRTEMGAESVGFMVARFFFVLPILLIPTTLMGSSLPLLARHFVRADEQSGRVGSGVGILYSVNTFGAVAGVFLAGFLLMPNIGVTATNFVACSMNLLLAVGIFVLRKPLLAGMWSPGEKLSFLPSKPGEAPAVTAPAAAAPPEPEPPPKTKAKTKKAAAAAHDADEPGGELPELALPIPPIARKAAFVAFAASGAAALCYEVAWTRALAMTIGSSVYGFSLILMTFLIGIAGGSAMSSAALSHPRRVPIASAIAAFILVMLANVPLGVDSGFGTWAMLTVGFAVPIVVVLLVVMSRLRSTVGPFSPALPSALLLLVPAAAAFLNGVASDVRVAPIAAAVTGALSVFLFLIVALRRYPVLALAVIQLFIAGATFVNYMFQDEIPCAFASLISSLSQFEGQENVVIFFKFLTSALVTLPATMGMGAMFPLTLRVWTSGGGNVGRDVGVVYAGNTAGSIVGAWLPGFILMPLWGLERTLHAGMILNLALALMMLIVSAADSEKKEAKAAKKKDLAEVGARQVPVWHAVTVYVLAPLIPALIALGYLGTAKPDSPLRWNLSQMTLGVFRLSLARDACNPETWGEPDLVYYHDGLSTTVSVERWGRHYALKNNGKVDASNGDDMPTQIMVAGFPLTLHPAGPENLDVAVVGFGSGVSVGTALQFPVRSVDVIELERSIPEASRFFEDVNHLEYPLTDFPYVQMDRLTVINDDGRNYLASTDKQYDIILSEPSNPWITGVSDLFTTDHFRITKQRLRPGGIYAQWVQLYEISPENIKTIYRTFASQFRHVVVFAAEDLSSDTVLIGSDQPIAMDLDDLQRSFAIPRVKTELERAYVYSPFDIYARLLLGSKQEVYDYTRIEERRRGSEWIPVPESNNDPAIACEGDCRRVAAPLNTDDNARIEFAAPKDLIGFARYEGYLAEIYSPEWPYGRIDKLVRERRIGGFGRGEAASRNYAELSMALVAHGRKIEAASFIDLSRREGPVRETLVALEVLDLLMNEAHEPRIQVEPPVPGPQLAQREARELSEGFEEVRRSVDQGAYATALSAMEEIPAPLRLHSGPGLRFLYGYLLYKSASGMPARYRDSIEQLEDLIRSDEEYARRHPELYYFLARAHDAEFNYDKALRNMRQYVEARVVPLDGDPAPEPPPGEAPATDAAGEADKTEHAYRGPA